MPNQSFQELAEKIASIKGGHKQKLIGIDGGGGAGKSTFAKELQKHLPNSAVIHVDDFYKGPWNARLEHKNYEVAPLFDWERFYREVLKPIQEGLQIQYHVYDWHKHTTKTIASVPGGAIVIIEGCYTTQEKFSDFYDFKIWIEAEEELRLDRALKRDGEHMRFLWEEDWLPVERNYIRVQNPASRADLIVHGHSKDFSEGYFNTP